jgi:hypothetical protein
VVSKQSSHRAFGCFSLLILNDRAAPSYQLLDLSLAGLPLGMLFLIADLLSFEVGVLVLSFLGNCLPLINRPRRDQSNGGPVAQVWAAVLYPTARADQRHASCAVIGGVSTQIALERAFASPFADLRPFPSAAFFL